MTQCNQIKKDGVRCSNKVCFQSNDLCERHYSIKYKKKCVYDKCSNYIINGYDYCKKHIKHNYSETESDSYSETESITKQKRYRRYEYLPNKKIRIDSELVCYETLDEQVRNPIQTSHEQVRNSIQTSHEQVRNPIQTSHEQVRNPIQTSHEQVRNPIQTSGEQVQNPIQTSGEQVKSSEEMYEVISRMFIDYTNAKKKVEELKKEIEMLKKENNNMKNIIYEVSDLSNQISCILDEPDV